MVMTFEPHESFPLAEGSVKTLVFDFDGTLASLEIDFQVMRQKVLGLAAEYYGDVSEFEQALVLESMETIRSRLAEQAPDQALEFISRARACIEEMELAAARKGGLFSFTRPVLAELKAQGFSVAIITRNFGGAVFEVFPDLADFCEVFLPRESVERVKPDPVHILAAMAALGASPRATLMVGDHPIDIETGRRAGTWTAGVSSGRMASTDLAKAGAHLVFNHVGELAEYLLGRGKVLGGTL